MNLLFDILTFCYDRRFCYLKLLLVIPRHVHDNLIVTIGGEGSMDIHLRDLLNIDNVRIKKYKVKFNQHNGEIEPINVYLRNSEEFNSRWLFWRNKKRYFNVGEYAICLADMGRGRWLLTTIKEVSHELNVMHGINYKGQECEQYSMYFGRVIIKYSKSHQTQVRRFESIIEEMIVDQILPSKYDGKSFPGYDSVRLSYSELDIIINRNKTDWVSALSNQKAIYLITDLKSGNQYVGAAYGENGMLFQRWTNYIQNGHGGNKLLKEIVKKEGFDYIKHNFQYSILENYNLGRDREYILGRESWWKVTLGSRTFGLNNN